MSGVHASGTETFVALRAEIDNWRWSGVPFFLRTGKRLPQRNSEIIVTFKQIRHSIFPEDAGPIVANKLVIRLQPDEGISQLTTMKAPGSGRIMLIPANLQLSFRQEHGSRMPEAYERLITDVIRGDATLFMRRDEVEASWRWIEPFSRGWEVTATSASEVSCGNLGTLGIGRADRTRPALLVRGCLKMAQYGRRSPQPLAARVTAL